MSWQVILDRLEESKKSTLSILVLFGDIHIESVHPDSVASMERKLYPQFLLIGDSHIQYTNRLLDGYAFVPALATHVERCLDIVIRGFSGYNSNHILNIIEHIVPSTSEAKVDYVVSTSRNLRDFRTSRS